ncbi:hypothetical protein NUU61_006222 [Penicillium alfredii]|uniref:Protein kinase domain-containing protein n=1 Tax=Penicillium alfredii TaxID=1506179 RepID=A0A9W9K419_9EURO|nr:uncharacterized protein NUU61_006222 [Penicillium alfredii]KAJ5091352.1 hypothetical protein NUU61_006222 [Penicillium alfredii]
MYYIDSAMRTDAYRCPYTVGAILPLFLFGQPAKATVTGIFEPFTLSCAMLVSVESQSAELNGDKTLKLFDRRFAAECREHEKVEVWVPECENQYHQFDTNDNGDSDGHDLTPAECEAYLHHRMQQLYKIEVEAYHAPEDIQGKYVPQFFASVTLPVPASSNEIPFREWVDIPGILIEYIEGFSLIDLGTCAPPEVWQRVGDEAIRIVHAISDRGILNEDVQWGSFIVNPNKNYEVRMTDFANCKFRREFGDDEGWRKWQAYRDEDTMERKLQQVSPGSFTYRRSERYNQLSYDFMREELG